MSERDFQLQVLEALGELKAELLETKAEVRNVVQRQDKANGSVARHQADIGRLQIELAERRLSCPLVDSVKGRVDIVEDFVTADKAVKNRDKGWLDRLWPMIYAAAGVTVYVAALHASDILKAMSAK
jgi:hypothetical protein